MSDTCTSPPSFEPGNIVSLMPILELPPFRVGDLVTLKSGSPLLTVAGIEKDTLVVLWFANEGNANVLRMPTACFLAAEETTT